VSVRVEDGLAALRRSLSGHVITRADDDYDRARRGFNAFVARRPAVIARCLGAEDVATAFEFSRTYELEIAVRGGGHNPAGHCVCDDGLVIDLSAMRGVEVDGEARTARAEGGATWLDFDSATQAFGLVTPGGVVGSTGVAGLTLGGGMGHLSRHYGLAIDNLLEADIVLADGSFVTASETQHPDLFWAIRGGGGNFGVVTSFLFRLFPVSTVYAGPMLWHMDVAEDVLRWFGEFLPSAPDELNGTLIFISVPPGPPFPEALWNQTMLSIAWCYSGPIEQADDLFLPIRTRFGPPALDWVGPMPYPVLQSMFDAVFPAGIQMYWKADFVNELPEESIKLRIQQAHRKPVGSTMFGFHAIDGAASRVAGDATPWAYRDTRFVEVFVGATPDPAENEAIIRWTRESWDALHPFSAGGGYVNFMMEEGNERIRATYRDNYDRLARIKAIYDPGNLFRVNQNIAPKA